MEPFKMPGYNPEKSKQENVDHAIDCLTSYQKKYEDPRPKELGDRVKVWDGSYNKDFYSSIRRKSKSLLFKKSFAIIIKTNCKKELVYAEIKDNKTGRITRLKEQLDLLLYFPESKEKIYCSSKCVARIDGDN